MKLVSIFVLLAATNLFGAFFIAAGIDVAGHIFPFVGFGFESDLKGVMLVMGMTYDPSEDMLIIEGSAMCFKKFETFKTSLNLTIVRPLRSSETLYMVGPGIGISPVEGVDLELEAMFSLPFGATEKIRGPIPILRFLWNSGTLF